MASEEIYVGKEGAKELYRRIRDGYPAVNDGKLTVVVGRSSPVSFGANSENDVELAVPLATGEAEGLARIASDVDSADFGAAVTVGAIRAAGYMRKVQTAAEGHVGQLAHDGSVVDSGIVSASVADAVSKRHAHGNADVLDATTAAYTDEQAAKLAGIEDGAQANVIETVSAGGTPVSVSGRNVDIPLMVGAGPHGAGTAGLVPAPMASDAGKFLRGNGEWATVETSSAYPYGPEMDGAASPGSSSQWSRGDHIHPTDTSREAASNKKTLLDPNSDTEYPTSGATARFVNSSIATNTANFMGTIDETVLGLDHTATNEEIASALDSHAFAATPTNNDYCFVSVDDPATTGVDGYRRFKFNGNSWAYEYTLNNSSFTEAQWAAINSGLSASDKAALDSAVSALNSHVSNAVIHVTSTDKTRWNSWQYDTFTVPDEGGAVIGGRTYRTVVIGNQEWLAENLDYKFDGLVIGGDSTKNYPHANYYSNDEEAYGVNGNKYGLLYNWIAVNYLNENKATLIPGWHVPTADEWNTLADTVGGAAIAGTKLKSTTGWINGNGDGEYGFEAFPAGRMTSSSFDGIDSHAYFWTSTEQPTNNGYLRSMYSGESIQSSSAGKSNQYSIRLVKDSD